MMNTTKTEIVFLVKFDRGYYAEKQPHYSWSYTQDALLAKRYMSLKKATERGKWGTRLTSDSNDSYEIEEYRVTTTVVMERVK